MDKYKIYSFLIDIVLVTLLIVSSGVIFHEIWHLINVEDPQLICLGLDGSGHLGAIFHYGDSEIYNTELNANLFGACGALLIGLLYVLRIKLLPTRYQ